MRHGAAIESLRASWSSTQGHILFHPRLFSLGFYCIIIPEIPQAVHYVLKFPEALVVPFLGRF